MDKLMCPICTGNLQLPKMCPHCSQVFCEQCITTYLAEKHFCPTCDNYIIDLVDCGRLVEELEQVCMRICRLCMRRKIAMAPLNSAIYIIYN